MQGTDPKGKQINCTTCKLGTYVIRRHQYEVEKAAHRLNVRMARGHMPRRTPHERVP